MRILADENMPERAVNLLRRAGHDVRWVMETDRGALDPPLLAAATAERRLLITYDKDFGDLLFQDGSSAPYGILLFRMHSDVPPYARAEFVYRTVGIRDPWPPGLWTIQIRHSE